MYGAALLLHVLTSRCHACAPWRVFDMRGHVSASRFGRRVMPALASQLDAWAHPVAPGAIAQPAAAAPTATRLAMDDALPALPPPSAPHANPAGRAPPASSQVSRQIPSGACALRGWQQGGCALGFVCVP